MAWTFARTLRAPPTYVETRLWSRLRRKQPFEPCVVDFFCPDPKPIIAVDGGQRADDDSDRTDGLERRGYRVVRFWNNGVLGNIDVVLLMILDTLRQPPSPGDARALPTFPAGGEAKTG